MQSPCDAHMSRVFGIIRNILYILPESDSAPGTVTTNVSTKQSNLSEILLKLSQNIFKTEIRLIFEN